MFDWCCEGEPIERAVIVLKTISEGHMCMVQLVDGSTAWCHDDDCEEAASTVEANLKTGKVMLHLSSLNALRSEGVYSNCLKQWRRIYIPSGCNIPIHLSEDVPESSGQRCLWAAGLVMTRYLEAIFASTYVDSSSGEIVVNRRASLHNSNVLELGCGAGLPAIYCHMILQAKNVYASEQSSCLGYVKDNMHLNRENINCHPDISQLHTKELEWGDILE